MQRWIPAQGSGVGVLRALPIVLAAIVPAQLVLGFGGALDVVPFEPASTLNAYVPQQDLELQKTVIDFVDSEILLGRKPPIFPVPKPVQPDPQSTFAAHSSQPTQPAPTAKQSSGDAAARISPFRKWVRPRASSAEAAQTEVADPVVARRSKQPTPVRQAQPLHSSASDSQAAVAAERLGAARGTTVDKKQAPPLTGPNQPQPSTPSYPDPGSAAANSSLPAANLPPLTRSQQKLRDKIRLVLAHYYDRPLNTRDRSPWELMHAMLAFETHSKVLQGGPEGEPITAVGWLCFNQACKRRTLMYVNDDDELRVRVGPALQGHRGQLLAMLAQSRVSKNYPMLVEGNELKVADLIEMEKRTCYPRTELTFKLIGLMHYLDSDERWLNDQGMEWDIPKLIAEEIRQPVRGAACGGTHRLSGLTLAYKTREKRQQPVDGEYLKAKNFVTRYQQYAYRLQNRDGSFSTEWFRGPGDKDDLDRKLKTTGHILEWLLYAASENELKHWRTTKAVNYLASILYSNRYKDWEAGPLGHAIHAILVYDRLVFAPYDSSDRAPIASQSNPSRQASRKR